ncbi:MAG: hypothetical protein AAGC64_09755 [Bacteroidota bacterium]
MKVEGTFDFQYRITDHLGNTRLTSYSNLFNDLSNHENIGNVIRVDIEGNLFSDPEGIDFVRGILQNLGIEGAHFDLARPGAEADKRIQKTTDNLKK